MPTMFTRIWRQRSQRRRGAFSVEYSSLVLLVALAYIALFSQLGSGLSN